MKVLGNSALWICLLFLQLIHVTSCRGIPASLQAADAVTKESTYGSYDRPQKVSVEVYVEGLCPGCQEFTVGPLANLFKSGLIDIVDLYVIPYGNARKLDNGTTLCQHGPEECELNRIEACAINIYQEQYKWFDFLLCLEEKDRSEMVKYVDSCAEKWGFSTNNLHMCADGPMGDKIMLANELETEELQPPHRWTPWVVVDGDPVLGDDLPEAFERRICEVYKGPTPSVCKKYKGVPKTNKSHPEVFTTCAKDQLAMDS